MELTLDFSRNFVFFKNKCKISCKKKEPEFGAPVLVLTPINHEKEKRKIKIEFDFRCKENNIFVKKIKHFTAFR